MDTMNILRNGSRIMAELASHWPDGIITDLDEVDKFFANLFDQTKGLVIVDFLDTDNWDYIKTYKIDHTEGLLTVYWKTTKDFSDVPEIKEISKSVFPYDSYNFSMKFKELAFIKIKELTFVTLRGYAVSQKDVKHLVDHNGRTVKCENNSDMFSVELVTEKDGVYEHSYFLNTPIYSVLFLPKDVPLQPYHSKYILYWYNLKVCHTRLSKANQNLEKICRQHLSLIDFEDAVCNVGNSMRRIMENVLKVELCHIINKKKPKKIKDYSGMLLGDLVTSVKDDKSELERQELNRIVLLSNHLSHDSGVKVTMEDAKELCGKIDDYIQRFESQIQALILM